MAEYTRWGILGNAKIARTQVIPAIQRSDNGRVTAIASRGQAPEETAAEFSIATAHASYESLLADDEVDAVYIPVPNSEHVQWVIAAAEAGKHVLCEKPLALNLADWNEAVAACEKAGVQLLEAFMYRFHPQHQLVRDLIAADEIGEVSSLHATFHFDIGDLMGSNVRLHGNLGGGALNDLGCYAVDSTTAILGRAPERAFATARWAPSDKKVDVTTTGTLSFGDVQTSFSCGFRGLGDSYTVIGNAGWIEVSYAYRPDVRGGAGQVIIHRADKSEFLTVVGDQYRLQVEAFANAVQTGNRLDEYTKRSEITTRTLDGLRKALVTGEPVTL